MKNDLCQPCRDRGRETLADRIVTGTPMCRYCFSGAPHPSEVDPMSGKPLHFKNLEQEEKKMGAAGRANGETREKVRELHENGVGASEIARRLGLKANSVFYHLKKISGNGSASQKPKTPKAVPVKPAPKAKGGDATATVNICLSETSLDVIWRALPIETKAELIEGWASEAE